PVRRLLPCGVLGGAALAVAAGAAGEPPTLRFDDAPRSGQFGSVSVSGLPEPALARLAERLENSDWERLLAVRIGEPGAAAAPPTVLGSYEVTGGVLRFRPRFPIAAGLVFHAHFDGARFDDWSGAAAGTRTLTATFRMPEPAERAAPRVVVVYPSATELPENLLRVYVHFSEPVFPKDVHDQVRLFDAGGEPVELPFVEIEGGLWDPARRRLTLFLHPGRIKRGVAPNTELGPPLRAGESFRLAVGGGFEKPIRALPADREAPDPATWRVGAPAARGEPLTLDFPEPLDHALLGRLIEVRGPDGATLPGRVTISHGETRWTFTPERPWFAGDHVLRIDPALEDVAGNAVAGAFEHRGTTRSPAPAEPVEIPFRVP
ncbi:MAG TPA: hypothetical protein VD788_17465, partial [Candidatus Polarisedimenticolaceae bacterium]|nr:hypothetical protein [Candidatus Polarisedimenticolaceae bacterium]